VGTGFRKTSCSNNTLKRDGDSKKSHPALVSNDGWLGDAAKLYAAGHDLKDPQLSPVYGDYAGFPPSILTTGTRDLFLSNTVRVHRKMRAAGVEAELHVFEGQSHAQYAADPFAPETKEHFEELARFFDKHLAKQARPQDVPRMRCSVERSGTVRG
jgi:acetyl esterase/lipase